MDSIRLGYACINTALRKKVFCSRSCTMDTLRGMGPEAGTRYLKELALQNIRDLLTILQWNETHGIRFFRITSGLFPHQGNHLLPDSFTRRSYYRGDIAFAHADLKIVGEYAQAHGHRLSFHTQAYIQLGTPRLDVLKRSVFEIIVYMRVYKAMAIPAAERCVILHGGGIYQCSHHATKHDAKQETLERWLSNYKKMPREVRDMIVLENDEYLYSVIDVLPFCEANRIPLCLDVFHNSISDERVAVTPALLKRVLKTWPAGRRPKFHLSEQEPDNRKGSHAFMVKAMPDYFFTLKNIDIMIEAKNKEQATMALYRKYFVKTIKNGRTRWTAGF